MASHAASTLDRAIIAMTNRPPRSSARPYPYVYRLVAGRRASRNAISSGAAVSASATLCSVSPSSATDPDSTTTAAWIAAVTAPRSRVR
jgi:hypothetical protein